jgi:pullulanase
VRNRVTDPYALSLSATRSARWIGRLDDPALKPAGLGGDAAPAPAAGATDLVIYELHVRDFSASDPSVPRRWRGKYLAFTEAGSPRHAPPARDGRGRPDRRAPAAGVRPGHGARGRLHQPGPSDAGPAAPDSPDQQALVMAGAARDCFNWGYDPWHFNAPRAAMPADADDGAVRIRELRQMVQALHAAGLRVGMDVVYNHTSASGQHASVGAGPHRARLLPAAERRGQVETSTCCANTATENRMMAKLMIDSVVVWARDHRIDSFRFDLMGHQPRAAMERLQRAVNAATGRHIHLIGEGWNFGEVANGARFVQASQASLNGSGIASFSDRGRDAARGGGCCDGAQVVATRRAGSTACL